MSARIREFLRTNLLGLVALFVAISGTAYATHPGGANTISTEDIINGQVQQPDIGTDAVNSARIANLTVAGNDLAPDSVRSSKILDGSIGSSDIGLNAVGSLQTINESLIGDDIHDGALSGQDVQDDSLTGDDVADDFLTGDDIDESTLGTVPGAATLDGLDSSDFARGNAKLDFAQRNVTAVEAGFSEIASTDDAVLEHRCSQLNPAVNKYRLRSLSEAITELTRVRFASAGTGDPADPDNVFFDVEAVAPEASSSEITRSSVDESYEIWALTNRADSPSADPVNESFLIRPDGLAPACHMSVSALSPG